MEFSAGGVTVAVSSDAGLKAHGMPASSPGHPFEIGLKTDNVDGAIAELKAKGVTMLREPFSSAAGNRVAISPIRTAIGSRFTITSSDRGLRSILTSAQ